MSCHKREASRVEQNLRINFRKDPVSLDPRKGNDMVASQVHFMLFEGLLRLNPDMSLSLAQAKSYEVSSDGEQYTFYLGNTVWSDGTPVTSFDFARAWKSILEPTFPSPDAYLLYSIKNARQAKAGQVSLDQVGIHCKDDKTLLVELEAPSPYFLQIVASSVLLPVYTKTDANVSNWDRQPETLLSNGPFRLKKWEFNQQLVFEKNPLYREADAVKLDHIFIDIIDREMAVLHMHATGYFDLVGSPLSFFPHFLLEDLEKRKLLVFFPVASTKFLSFNTSRAPFQNVNVRRALALAIDRKSLVEHITKLNEQKALNIIPPALLPDDGPYFPDGDIAQAKKYFQQGLRELNIKETDPISLMYVFSEGNHMLAQTLQQMWRKAFGIEIVLEHVEFKTLHERSDRGDFSIGLFAWLADYGDPMNILERFTDQTNHRNYSKWKDEAYNNLLREMLQAPCRSVYLKKVKEAEKILIDQMPFTCLYHENYAFLIHPYVEGLAISPLGHIYFERISINAAKKKKAGIF